MLKIILKKGEKIEYALKRLKRKFNDTGVLKNLRNKKAFEKPSITKCKQKKKAQYIQKLRDQEEY
jgi:small subunit ribosomal protein S21